jgi:SAM-dependent methyltransferase
MNVHASYLPQVQSQNADLGQRGRADLQVLGAIQVCAFHEWRSAARADFYATEQGQALAEAHQAGGSPAEVKRRVAEASTLAEESPAFRMERFLQRYVAEENWRRAIVAVETKRDRFSDFIKPPPSQAHATLSLDPDLPLPRFFTEVEFHLQPGGWEGYDLYGPVLSHGIYPHVFARGGFAAMPATPKAIGYRASIMKLLPKTRYDRIFEVGCGSGSTTRWLHQVFPDAELHGCDLSAVQLKSGFAVAEKAGVPIHFKQADGRRTHEPSESFDLVVENAVAHEMPPKANVEVFQEMFRILKPGGDVLLMDPPPFRSVDPFQAALLNWETDHREEPFFSAALLSDWEAELAKIGFVNIVSTVVDGVFPWVLTASKAPA